MYFVIIADKKNINVFIMKTVRVLFGFSAAELTRPILCPSFSRFDQRAIGAVLRLLQGHQTVELRGRKRISRTYCCLSESVMRGACIERHLVSKNSID